MDKSTLSNYGWIVIAVLVLAVMIALATPFGSYIKTGVENTTQGLFDTSEKAMNVVGMSASPKAKPEHNTVSGNTISVTDADTALQTLKINLSSDTKSDFSDVKVTKLGKNLFDMNAFVKSGHVTINGDEMLWKNTSGMLHYTPEGIIDGQSYTLQLNVTNSDNVQALIYYTDGSLDKVQTRSNIENQYLTLTSNKDKTIDYIFFGAGGGMAVGTIFKEIQFELGDVATEYEPYSATEYNSSVNGIVGGVKNTASVFTLVTNNDDVKITCEYQKKN